MLKKLLLCGVMLLAVILLAKDQYSEIVDAIEEVEAVDVTKDPVVQGDPVIELCSALSKAETYGDDNSFRYMISGKNGWIFRTELDLKENIKLSDWSSYSFKRLKNAFRYNGINDVAIMVMPTRGVVGHEYLVPNNFKDYDYKEAINDYVELLDGLRSAGYIVADMHDVHKRSDYFLKRDNHWTALGAKYSAERMATAIKSYPIYKRLRKSEYKTTIQEVTDGYSANDRFLQFIEGVCGEKPLGEALPAIYNTSLADVADTSSALFGEAEQPEIVLIGTSNSTRMGPSYANFAGFLKEYLSVDIANESVSGGAFRGSIANYISSGKYKEEKPKVIIWELNAYYGFDQKATFREIIPTLYGECSDSDVLFIARGDMKEGRNYIFDDIDDKDMFLSDYYIYLELENKDLRKFKVDFVHYGKVRDKFKVKRTSNNFPESNGKFFIELKSNIDKPLKSVVITMKGDPDSSYIAKMCKVPSDAIR